MFLDLILGLVVLVRRNHCVLKHDHKIMRLF